MLCHQHICKTPKQQGFHCFPRETIPKPNLSLCQGAFFDSQPTFSFCLNLSHYTKVTETTPSKHSQSFLSILVFILFKYLQTVTMPLSHLLSELCMSNFPDQLLQPPQPSDSSSLNCLQVCTVFSVMSYSERKQISHCSSARPGQSSTWPIFPCMQFLVLDFTLR